MKLVIFLLFTALLTLGYQNCAPYERAAESDSFSSDLPGNMNNDLTKSIEAFELTLEPVITGSQSCSGCHGVTQFPLFAVLNSSQAHSALLTGRLVDLNNPSNSRLVRKIREGHQNYSNAKADEIEQAIASWAQRNSL